ncbi:MAG: ubiquinol-cytochrome c reductase iron-sulfur subunit [Kineosporiaceae bacterium]
MAELCMSRRDLIRALGAVGVTTIGAGVLVACGSDDGGAAGGEGATGGATGGGTGGAGGSVPLADVPVGEARVVDLAGRPVVVARPDESTVVAFSARCTHQGTTVEVSEGLELVCPNHGSEFRADDGSVLTGPATRPLEELTATIDGDTVTIA